MDCPNCGVYNPEEREVCWRCNTELPKKKQPERRNPQKSARLWLYVAAAVFAILTLFRMCNPPAIDDLTSQIDPLPARVAHYEAGLDPQAVLLLL